MSGIRIEGAKLLVTGANRGIGRALVEAALERGAARVYAGARRRESLHTLEERFGDRVVALRLDVTEPDQITAAAEAATEVDILVNNAGVAGELGRSILDPDGFSAARLEMEVNYFGLLRMSQAFAGVLRSRERAAVVNLGSVAALVNFPLFQSYSASKAAVHSASQALRLALGGSVQVTAVYPGPVDTDMAEGIPFAKTSPAAVAEAILDGIEAGDEEIFPDAMAREMGGAFFQDPKALEREVAAMVADSAA